MYNNLSRYDKYGFKGIIAKPFNIEGFLNVVEDVLSRGPRG